MSEAPSKDGTLKVASAVSPGSQSLSVCITADDGVQATHIYSDPSTARAIAWSICAVAEEVEAKIREEGR